MKPLLTTLFLLLLRQAIAQDAGTNGTIATYVTNLYFDAVSMTSSNLALTFKDHGWRCLYSINDGPFKKSDYRETLTIKIGDKLEMVGKGNSLEFLPLPEGIKNPGFQVKEFIERLSVSGTTSTSNFFLIKYLEAQVSLKPEALNVTPGVLTAFVRLPEGYLVKGIISVTCDGAPSERMMLNDDGTEMIIKFRRNNIETALAQVGERIDTNFVVRGIWQDAGRTNFFEGTASIKKIVSEK